MNVVGDLVSVGARRLPDRIAVRMREGDSRTYGALDDRTNRLGHALIGAGLNPGDRVAAWLEDSIEYVELHFAAAKAGLTMVPINSRFKVAEAKYQFEDSGAQALFVSEGMSEKASLLLTEVDTPRLVVAVGTNAVSIAISYETFLSQGSSLPLTPPHPSSPYMIAYTSGTTGFPKGAILTHQSVMHIVRINTVSYRLPIGSICAFAGTMSFAATVPAHLMTHLYVGGSTIFMGPWDTEGLLHTIAANNATFTYFPTPMIEELTELLGRGVVEWRSLQTVLQSGSRAHPDVLRQLYEVIGSRLVQGWGMTELSGGLATVTASSDFVMGSRAQDIFSSAGRPTVESVVDVVDEDGQPVPADGDSVGDLVITSPAVMQGYWKQSEATARVLKDGRYFSGDMGYRDAAGYVYISDRRTDLIVSGGMNVYPAELELVISRLSGVKECAVIGVPHERWGQTPLAIVVRVSGATLTEMDVIQTCRETLASYKKPSWVVFVDALPRNINNKVVRQMLRDQMADVVNHLSSKKN